MALRLHVTAHHAEGTDRFSSLHQESGNDGMITPLAGRQTVGGGGIQRKVCSAVLKRNAGAVHYNGGAKSVVI